MTTTTLMRLRVSLQLCRARRLAHQGWSGHRTKGNPTRLMPRGNSLALERLLPETKPCGFGEEWRYQEHRTSPTEVGSNSGRYSIDIPRITSEAIPAG
jgi:hypothetical protein